MKSILLIILLIFSSNVCFSQGTLSGNIMYANSDLTSIHDSTLVRLYQGDTLKQQIPVSSDGSFSFDSLPEGNYTVNALVSKVPGGWNTMDSYLCLRHYVGLNPLYGIYLIAADVNASGIPSSSDAHFILHRFTYKLKSFYSPTLPNSKLDWVSENKNVAITTGTNQAINVKVLCTGDVNGSFIPY